MTLKKNQSKPPVANPEVKVLIIEDNPKHLKDMIEIVGRVKDENKEAFILKIDTADSKEDAEKKLIADNYHVLIVDIMLGPIMDGGMEIIENLSEMKNKKTENDNDKKSILVITSIPEAARKLIVSHRFDGKMRQRAKKVGVKAYFVKPIPINEFRKVLLGIINQIIQKLEVKK
jgi:CheY-like chemotaxis protein